MATAEDIRRASLKLDNKPFTMAEHEHWMSLREGFKLNQHWKWIEERRHPTHNPKNTIN